MSPPDQMPLSLAEAWMSAYAAVRTVVLSMHRAWWIVLVAWGFRLANQAAQSNYDVSPFPCNP